MKVRIKFSKTGPMKFLGHLDTMRYFQKAVRRAGLPVAFTQGFSPHMIMSFASPLGVGIESEGEYFDLELREEVPMEAICSRLNAQMAEGTRVECAVQAPDGKAGNAMALVAAADYRIRFREGKAPGELYNAEARMNSDGDTEQAAGDKLVSGEVYNAGAEMNSDGDTEQAAGDKLVSGQEWQDKIEEFLAQPSIMIKKTTKTGEKDVDIRPYIYEMRMEEDGSDEKVSNCSIFCRLAAASSNFTKPDAVMDAFYAFLGEEKPEFACMITRLELYADRGTEEEHDFVPLYRLTDDSKCART